MEKNMESVQENPFDDLNSPIYVRANNVLAVATLVSILAIVLETVHSFSQYHPLFKAIEYITTVLFTAEYIWRLRLANVKWKYMVSFFGIVDLAAIIPTYLGIGNLTFLKSARALRILRFLRMVRLAKLTRASKDSTESKSLSYLNVQIYGVALLLSLLALGSLIYLFESSQEYAKDIPSGMYWAFKVVLGGVPNTPQPQTTAGIFVFIAAKFVSLILLGLMLNLVGTLTRKMLTGSEQE